jgi:hypothetical protein
MGMFDAFKRTIANTMQRDQANYSMPASRPADPRHASTNSDSSVEAIRRYTSTGPARTVPPSAGAAGSVPSPDGTLSGSGRTPASARQDFEPVGPPASGARDLPYGLQRGEAESDRPGGGLTAPSRGQR